MKTKKIKKTIVTTTALGLAISSFFQVNLNEVEISYKDHEEIRDIEDDNLKSEIKSSNRNRHILTRNDVARILFSIGSIIAIIFKMLGRLIIKAFKGASAHSLLISTILDALSIFIIILVLFIVLFKLIYPEKSLKELLSLKNIFIIFLVSMIISIILNNLDLFHDQKIIMIIIESIASCLILFIVYAYLLHSKQTLLTGPKALIKTKKGRKTISIMLVSNIIGCLVKILLTKYNILVSITNLILIIILSTGLAIIVIALRKRKLVNYSVEFPEKI